MKNKDYVGQSNKRKKPKKKEAPAPSRPFPFVRFTIVLSLVGAFAYFLFFITQEDQATQTVDKTSSQPSKNSQQETALPPLPDDEEWQFIEELENKKVDVTTEELADKGPFKMQCASFRSESDAEALKAKIAFAGFESQVRSAQGTTGIWYKVILGPYDRKRDAEKTRHILKRNNINDCAIWPW